MLVFFYFRPIDGFGAIIDHCSQTSFKMMGGGGGAAVNMKLQMNKDV